MYAQAAIKSNTLLRNGAYGIVMRGVQKCTRGCSSLRGRNRLPLCCIKLDTATDPCMGSGHILVYAFDVFMDIYTAQGYTERDAAQRIVEKNLYGLELDDRATQLAYFAVMMKARSYDRRFLTRGIRPNLCSIQESNSLNTDYLELFGDLKPTAQKLVDEFIDAKEYGSILNLKITADEIAQLENKYAEIDETIYDNIFDTIRQVGLRTAFVPLIRQAKIMVKKYEVVCTNPPYMAISNGTPKLNAFVKKYFPNSKADMFAVFMEVSSNYCKNQGYYSLITQPSLLSLTSFENLRNNVLEKCSILSLLDMGRGIFGIDFGSTSFVIKNTRIKSYLGTFFRLHQRIFQYINPDDISKMYLDSKYDRNYRIDFLQYDTNTGIEKCKSRNGQQVSFDSVSDDFAKIPGSPIAYWVSGNFIKTFNNKKIGEIASPKKGLDSADNNRFVRYWYEPNYLRIGISYAKEDYKDKKWYPLNSGGGYRKWYGNFEKVVNWENNGAEMRAFPKAYIRAKDMYFCEGLTWTKISSTKFGIRYTPVGFIFDSAGQTLFSKKNNLKYLLGLLCSVYTFDVLQLLNPTINFQVGDIANIPVVIDEEKKEIVDSLVSENIEFSKNDWNSFETSWNFVEHPFVRWSKGLWDCTNIAASVDYFYGDHPSVSCPLELCFMLWQGECNDRFNKLKANEEELNRIFIDIYGLQDELTPEVEDKDVTVRKADLKRDMRSFISYAVGCMFGRYSLDTEGLVYAGGKWDSEKYKTFIPDEDNCIPITDTAYFEDDIVGRFCEFVKDVYGEDTLEANLEFIAKALGNKGNTSRDIIRNYFLNDFFKDHCKIYQKRPIYWLFDSGKQNAFKALVYMHRWNADTIGNMRVEYLHRIQRTYEKEIEREQDTIDNTTNNRDRAAATKRKEKLQKQLKETKEYDAKVAHLALSRPDIDLDDGVKVNYEKVQTAQDGKKLQILAKI